MKREIERKFLITSNDYKQNISSKHDIIQGYLSTKPSRTVRIRVGGGKGYLTIKGGTSKNGLCRLEWEKELPLEEADELMALCLPNKIEKTRCKVNYKGWLFEVDIFKGINEGLKIAEIELDSEADIFEKPKWLGEEVTGIKKYYNSQLCQNPFTKW
ncbi:MAG: CYTH domain-containing protein [Flavobacteriaceae bacterium]